MACFSSRNISTHRQTDTQTQTLRHTDTQTHKTLTLRHTDTDLEAIGLGAGEVQSEHVAAVDCAQHPTHFILLVMLVVRLRPSVTSPPNFEGVVIL